LLDCFAAMLCGAARPDIIFSRRPAYRATGCASIEECRRAAARPAISPSVFEPSLRAASAIAHGWVAALA